MHRRFWTLLPTVCASVCVTFFFFPLLIIIFFRIKGWTSCIFQPSVEDCKKGANAYYYFILEAIVNFNGFLLTMMTALDESYSYVSGDVGILTQIFTSNHNNPVWFARIDPMLNNSNSSSRLLTKHPSPSSLQS